MHYLQEDAPGIEIDLSPKVEYLSPKVEYLSPKVGDLSLRVDLNLLKSL
jgi:hypothetical protein